VLWRVTQELWKITLERWKLLLKPLLEAYKEIVDDQPGELEGQPWITEIYP
jgi:hypothetical protein